MRIGYSIACGMAAVSPLAPVTAAVIAMAGGLFGGCTKDIAKPKPSERSDVTIALPAAPDLAKKPYDKLNADGSYTVEGILRERDKLIGESVTVRGVVKKLQKCPPPPPPPPPEPDAVAAVPEVVDSDAPPRPPPRPARTCNPPPSLYLVDAKPASKRELLVYGSMWSVLPTLGEGQEVSLTGSFDIVSKDGVFLRQAGLLVLDDLPAPEAPVAEPGSDTKP